VRTVKVEDECMARERGVAREMAKELFRAEQQKTMRGVGVR
jgi:hypothetical protein